MTLPYDHELTSKITRSSDREQNERLYPRVMAGDEAAREEMIEANMPLVIAKVNSYIRRYPQLEHLRDDLHGAGFVGLVQAVNKMAEHKEPSNVNPTGYISVAITHEFVKLAKKEAVHSGIELADTPEIDMDATEDTTVDAPNVSHSIPESVIDVNQSESLELLELRDLIESCCESEKERTLIRMRAQRYSDREIAEVIGLTHTATYKLRKELEQRFNQKRRELKED